jgi:hypothetical protein
VFLDPNDVMKKARIENAEIEMKSWSGLEVARAQQSDTKFSVNVHTSSYSRLTNSSGSAKIQSPN